MTPDDLEAIRERFVRTENLDEGKEYVDALFWSARDVPALLAALAEARRELETMTYVAQQNKRHYAQQTEYAIQIAEQRDDARAALAEAQRERDSLARRCALRFEETEKLRAEVDAHEGELGDMRASLSAAEADRAEAQRERDEARQHSITLNTISYKIGEALGHATAGEPFTGDPVGLALDLIEGRNELFEEMQTALASVELMRPVVEAATAWRDRYLFALGRPGEGHGVTAQSRELVAAVDTYEKQTGGTP